MRVFLPAGVAVVLATTFIHAQQPPVTNVAPTISSFDVAWGGAGPNSNSTFTISGAAFSTSPHATRFVDATNGTDVFQGVSCSSSTTCTASLRAGLAAAGTIKTIAVKALTPGGTSAGSLNFIYYGAPLAALSPNTGPYNASTAYNINGGPFTTGSASNPGLTSVYLFTSIFDGTCASQTLCSRSAPAISADCCTIQGAKQVSIRTPGGSASPYFLYGETPNTPTITSVSPAAGPSAGGNAITITGTNFIAGAQSGVTGPWGVRMGTGFTFITPVNSVEATSVSCSSTTTCTLVVPAGVAGSVADIQVMTICPAGSSAAGCGGTNARPSGSIPTIRTAAYAYAGIKTNPAPGLFGGGPYLYTSENGGTTSFSVALTSQPTAAVHVTLAVSPAGQANVAPAAGLDFTTANWATPQTVTVVGLDTGAGTGNVQYNVNMTASSADTTYNTLFASSPGIINVDNDSKQILVAPQAGLVTTRAGGTATFQVVLSQQPSATVTVNLASSDTTLGVLSVSSLTFDTTAGGVSSWNTPRSVTVTGQPDAAQAGTPRPYSILMTVSSTDTTYGDPTTYWPDIQVTNQDAAPLITANPSNQQAGPGQVATFTASATASPAPTVQWQVAANTSGAPFVDVAGATSTTLSFTVGAGDDGKAYRAVFTNAGGSSTTTVATLTFPPSAPAITVNPVASMTVLTGNVIFLSSAASGSPAPTVQWQVSTNGGGSWTNYPGATSPNLSFAALRFDNGKQYRALYTNAQGSTATTATSLFVRLRVRSDIDNPQDRKSDLVIWRPGVGTWFWLTSSSTFNYAAQGQKQWGSSAQGDIPISADMDGDGIMDLVVWRPTNGTFFWLTSSTGYNYASQQQKQWGNNGLGDKPFIGDIDGDGKGDLIVWRPSNGTWFYLLSSNGYNYANQGQTQWGNSALGDQPMIADFDGDGRVDFTVWRASTGTWFWLKSTTSYAQQGQVQWGNNALGDIPLVADLDGDGASDIVVWRPTDSTFYWLTSLSGFNQAAPGVRQWGSSAQNDVPMLGDLDGDGAAELIVWRPANGTWFWLTAAGGYSYGGQQQKQWGSSAQNDVPMMKGGIY